MTDLEKRLKALEKAAVRNEEHMQHLEGQAMALSLIFNAIGAPLCTKLPAILPAIISNLRNYEKAERAQNGHASAIEQLQRTRIFFEAHLKKIERGPPAG